MNEVGQDLCGERKEEQLFFVMNVFFYLLLFSCICQNYSKGGKFLGQKEYGGLEKKRPEFF